MTTNFDLLVESKFKQMAAAGLAAASMLGTPAPQAQAATNSSISSQAPRGIRNNNPGNIEAGGDNWEGAIGDDGRFLKFNSMDWGVRAIYRILITYKSDHKLDTIRGIVSRWAPPNENDTEKYIRNVSDWMQTDDNERLNMHNPVVLKKLAHSIARQETGHRLDDQTLEGGLKILYNNYER